MGADKSSINVAIINEDGDNKPLQPITSDKRFDCRVYLNLEEFLRMEGQKNLSSVIIKYEVEDDLEDQDIADIPHVTSSKIQENAKYWRQICMNKDLKKKTRLKQKMIGHINRYGLEDLKICLLVKKSKAHSVKITDDQTPYITLISDNCFTIAEHIYEQARHKNKEREEINMKFRKLTKDLYKRKLVTIVDENHATDHDIEIWKERFQQEGILYGVCASKQDFEKKLISEFTEYVMVKDVSILAEILELKTLVRFQSKIIFYGSQDQIDKVRMRQIWIANRSITYLLKIMKNCADKIIKVNQNFAENTILLVKGKLSASVQIKIGQQLRHILNQQYEKDAESLEEIKAMKISVVLNTSDLEAKLKESIYSYLVTIGYDHSETQSLKRSMKIQKFNHRILIHHFSTKMQFDEHSDKHNLEILKKMSEEFSFTIKYEIGPLQSVTTYKLEATSQYIQRSGIQATNIATADQLRNTYFSDKKEGFMESHHLICNVKDYQNQLKKIFFEERKSNQKSISNKICIILEDSQEAIKNFYLSRIQRRLEMDELDKTDSQIIFMHDKKKQIISYLSSAFVTKISVPFFKKKSLPKFVQSLEIFQNDNEYTLNAAIISKKKLLSEVFEGNQDNLKMQCNFQFSFIRFPCANRNYQFEVSKFQKEYLKRYADLWLIGYEFMCEKNSQDCIQILKSDICRSLYKCKNYDLLKLSDREFKDFYLESINSCETYIELQIACIYIFSLPHGLNNVIQYIFKNPRQTCLTPKIFGTFIVTLMSSFCSFQDKVIDQKRVSFYIDDDELFKNIVDKNLNAGDYLFNTGFLQCGSNSDEELSIGNSIILEFENIPHESNSKLMHCLFIERFSFYKEATQYLVAPYTKFVVKSIKRQNAKIQVVLNCISENGEGFLNNIFDANNIKEDELFRRVFEEAGITNSGMELKKIITENNKKIKKQNSFYKRAQLINLYEEKISLMHSIRESQDYNNFIQLMKRRNYLSALSSIRKKELKDKKTTQLQNSRFRTMLGVQKALIYYRLCEYELGIQNLDRVIQYLKVQRGLAIDDWLFSKITSMKRSLEDNFRKRQKVINRAAKTKKWTVTPQINEVTKRPTVVMKQEEMEWSVHYVQEKELFTIENDERKDHHLVPYAFLKINFGESTPSHNDQKLYLILEDIEEILRIEDNSSQFPQEEIKQRSDNKIRATQEFKPLSKEKIKSIKLNEISQKNTKVQLLNPLPSKKIKSQNKILEVINPKAPKQQTQKRNEKEKNQQEKREEKREENKKVETKIEKRNIVKNQILKQTIHVESQKKEELEKQFEWQAFYYEDNYLLTQKGKHFKVKIPNTMNEKVDKSSSKMELKA